MAIRPVAICASALRECCELADAVESLQGPELLEVLIYLDSLRFVMAESGQLLQGVVRGMDEYNLEG